MKLVAQSGPLAGRELPIDKPVLVLGRGAGSDILLEDQEVSRRHAEIRFAGGQVSITDAGSMNGTFVNGMRIQASQVLLPGDEIRAGTTIFRLQEGVTLAPAAAVDSDLGLAEPPAVAGGRGSRLGLILGAAAVLVILVIAALVAFLVLRSKGGQATVGGGAVTPTAGQAVLPGTSAPAQGTPAPPSGATATPLVQLFVTFTPRASVPTVASSPAAGGGGAPGQPMSTPQAPPFTVKWSPGRYEGWAEGKRMSSDLTIGNVALAEIRPPYAPYFIVSDPQGKMRQADLKDYGEGKGPPTIPKGQTITWTWFGVMDKHEWVRGSVFRYAGYAWAQEFNPDGSLAGQPRVIDEKQLIPFLPKEVPPEMLPTLAATMAAGGMPTGIPTGVPSGVPTGIPTAKP